MPENNNTYGELDSVTMPLDGITMIEAAAGTGKTYNIQILVARLILEKSLPIDSIAVLSFTNEAAAELSNRIRKILDEILSLLENIPVQDPKQAQDIIEHDKLIHPDTTTKERIAIRSVFSEMISRTFPAKSKAIRNRNARVTFK